MTAHAPQQWSEVRSGRLLLRRPTESDAPFVLTLHAEPRTTEHNRADALRDLAGARARVASWSEQWVHELGYWIVEESVTGRPVASAG